MTISDEVFKKELDIALKKQGILKKERNNKIENYLIDIINDRDSILDFEEKKAREIEAQKKEDKLIPLESEEQKEYVRWFKELFIGIDIMMIRNDGSRTFAERPEQILMGLLKGATDLLIPDWHLWVEMKRLKGSIISEEQYSFAERRIANGDFHFFAFGAEDAKKKTVEFIINNIDNKLILDIINKLLNK